MVFIITKGKVSQTSLDREKKKKKEWRWENFLHEEGLGLLCGPCLLQFERVCRREVALANWQETERVVKGLVRSFQEQGWLSNIETQKLLPWAILYHTLPTLSVKPPHRQRWWVNDVRGSWWRNLDFSAPEAWGEEGAASSQASGKMPGGPGPWSQKGKHENTLSGKTWK